MHVKKLKHNHQHIKQIFYARHAKLYVMSLATEYDRVSTTRTLIVVSNVIQIF